MKFDPEKDCQVCKGCERLIPLVFFYAKQNKCMECIAAVRREYYARNREKLLAQSKEYNKATDYRRKWREKRKLLKQSKQ